MPTLQQVTFWNHAFLSVNFQKSSINNFYIYILISLISGHNNERTTPEHFTISALFGGPRCSPKICFLSATYQRTDHYLTLFHSIA